MAHALSETLHGDAFNAMARPPYCASSSSDASSPPPRRRLVCLRESDLATVPPDGDGVCAPHWTALRRLAAGGGVEPSSEPCGEDEIPLADLVYWLGNASTGQVECACGDCARQRSGDRDAGDVVESRNLSDDGDGYYVYIPTSFYERLRAKIPVIAVPRIEGIN